MTVDFTLRNRGFGGVALSGSRLVIPLRASPRVRALAGLRGFGEMPYLDCTSIVIMGGTGTACVNENLRRQQANFAEHDQEQRAKHLADCNRDWKLNDDQRRGLNLPLIPNTCELNDFGSNSPFAQPGFTDTPEDVYERSTPASAYQYQAPPPPAAATAAQPGASANSGAAAAVCAADAKVCWDGSTVGRTGANCAFAACPTKPAGGSSSGGSSSGAAAGADEESPEESAGKPNNAIWWAVGGAALLLVGGYMVKR